MGKERPTGDDNRKRNRIRIIMMFVLSIVLFIFSSILIWSTWGTGPGRTILFIMGIVLIVIGTSIMIKAILELIDILRS